MSEETSGTSLKENRALDAFLNLLSLITIVWLSISFSKVISMIIDHFLNVKMPWQGDLKFSIASLVIIAPAFLIVMGIKHRKYKKLELNCNSGIYRWLTYVMLLASAVTIIISLVIVISRLLDGDYTLATILKMITVLLVAGAVFGYFFYDLKRRDYARRSKASVVAVTLTIIVVVVAIAGSMFVVDPPHIARAKRFDRERVDDLSQIDGIIVSHFWDNDELPADLSAGKFSKIVDPETKEAYEYKVIDQNTFEVCATFNMESDERSGEFFMGGNEWYYHGAGPECFKRRVDPDDKEFPKPVIIR